MSVDQTYHLAALVGFGLSATFWKNIGWQSLTIKLSMVGLALWSAVMVAKVVLP